MQGLSNIMPYFTDSLGAVLSKIPLDLIENAEEIHLRADKPLIISSQGKDYFLEENGKVTANVSKSYKTTSVDISKTLEKISHYSIYAFEEELRNGYITIAGGHRVGISGKVVLDGEHIKTIKNINGLNIRISHQVLGCSNKILDYVVLNGSAVHTMIISPPCCGKTTLLRDLIRCLSDGVPGKVIGQSVGVSDERSEIAGCYIGIPQNDVGIRTDVLDCCPKDEGMLILLRAMSPRIIAVDEIGKPKDMHAIEDIILAGVTLICTVHGSSIEEIRKKPILGEILSKGIFKRYVLLKNRGDVEVIYNENFEKVYPK